MFNNTFFQFLAVRHDRMRGGRNKFGPMYKRDRARKLQVMRHRSTPMPCINIYTGAGTPTPASSSSGGNAGSNSLNGNGQSTMYTSPLHIKQEIQIPQVTSMTSSPDSSPSPVQLPHGLTMSTSGGSSAGGATGTGGLSTQGQIIAQQTDPSTGGIWQISTSPNSGNRVSIVSERCSKYATHILTVSVFLIISLTIFDFFVLFRVF